MPKGVGFGVVGLGMGHYHCYAIARARGARLAAVCDTDESRRRAAVEQFGCRGYAHWSDMLEDRAIDCINICVESGKHAEFGSEAVRAGKHIIVEKPVDITVAAIERLEAAVRRSGVKAGCIFQSRVEPLNVALKRAIDQGKMGEIFGVHALLPWWRAQEYYEGPHGSWKGTWAMDGGGSLMNQGIHTLDLLQWLAGPVESVSGFYGVFNHDIEAEDQTVAVLRFENGALGTLATTTCCVPGGEPRILLYGSRGSFARTGARLESYHLGSERERARMMATFGNIVTSEATHSDPMALITDGHKAIVEDMAKAIQQDREPLIPISSARHAVEIATAVFQSARTGKVVRVAGAGRASGGRKER